MNRPSTIATGIVEKEHNNIRLSLAGKSDLPLLLEYMQGLRRDDPLPVSTAASDVESSAAMRRLIDDASIGKVWLIYFEQTPVGYAALTFVHSIEFGGRCAFLDELYVAPEWRGRGVGRGALELIAAASRSLGVRTLLLEVSPENERAAGLYRSAGFSERKYRLLVKRINP